MGGNYEYWLTLLSILVVFIVSLLAFGIAAWVHRQNAKAKPYWLLAGGIAMGSVVWSAHFASLLVFSTDKPVAYELGRIILSWLIAIAAISITLRLIARPQLLPRTFIVNALLIGPGLSGMCYLSISALQLAPGMAYIPSLFALLMSIMVTMIAMLWLIFVWLQVQKVDKTQLFRLLGLSTLPVFAIGLYAMGITGNPSNGIMSAPSTPALLAIIGMGTAGLVFVAFFFLLFGRHGYSLHLTTNRTRKELSRMAMMDILTQLPNRRLFHQHLELAVERCTRVGNSLALAYIDLDGFKPVNDSLGHHVGDEVLRNVAKRLNMAVRGCDVVARLGGDEFVALIEDIKSNEDIVPIVERIVQSLREIFYIANHEIAISASVGIAVYPRDGKAERLMECADAAMYRAKSDGKNQFRFYDAEIELASYRLLEMQRELNHALTHDEFKLYFQPKIDSQTHALAGVEVLLRWQHTHKGMVLPSAFIAGAERFGLINTIGDWVIEESCRVLHRLRSQGIVLKASINLSSQQLRNPNLVMNVLEVLRRFDLPTSSLMFEITDCNPMSNMEQFNALLDEFRNTSFELAMDDFCTGNFSLSYLENIRINELKLDRALINQLSKPQPRAVVKAVVRLAHALNLRVVAEGVETEAQRRILTEIGCDQLQGFLFSPPVPETRLLSLIRKFSALTPAPGLEDDSAINPG